MRILIAMALLVLPAAARAQIEPAIMPRPARMVVRADSFTLAPVTTILLPNEDKRLDPVVELLRDALTSIGIRSRIGLGRPRPGVISIEPLMPGTAADSEAYDVFVTRDGVRLRGGSATGLIWAVQTLRQLVPAGREGNLRPDVRVTIPAVEIHDAPRFRWRGVLMDAGRHFFPVDAMKRQIDLMSRYKLNVLHWHLTEDQGWRIEIRKYPRLTEVGAWRTEADGTRYGGFYTQADVREVVEYARRHGVSVVPEIELPGHSSAAIASYPWLGCTGDSIAVPTTWGVFADIYCPTERTFGFLEDVLDEVVALFPSPYIHIGGDEVPKDRWRDCDSCQALMRRENLRDEAELQTWFIARIGRHLERRGRRMIGWDEILEGGLPRGAIVQVWRDTASVRTAIRAGADVIVSPTSHAYLDYSPASLPLSRVHAFDAAAGLDAADARHVLGGEANLWSEYILPGDIDLLAWPRLLAMAEALWSVPAPFADFKRRLDTDQYVRLRSAGVRPGPEDLDLALLRVGYDSITGRAFATSRRGVRDIAVRFTTDGSEPLVGSPSLGDSMGFDSGRIVMRAFLADHRMILRREIGFADHLGRGRGVATTSRPAGGYPGTGPRTLTDGLLASTDHHDGLWQGWQGRNVDAAIDLGEARDLRVVEASFLESGQSWILLPRGMTVSTSADGVAWNPAGRFQRSAPDDPRTVTKQTFSVALPPGTRARFVRVDIENPGPLPAWHQAAGRPSWIFADEIIVR